MAAPLVLLGPLCRLLRRLDFRGKGRISRRIPAPRRGITKVVLRRGIRLELDLSESLQRDYFVGMYDQFELKLVRALLRDGGDFVDVGAYVGLYSLTAAATLRDRGRVLAFEPNPRARARLVSNLVLNECTNVVVLSAAASAGPGQRALAVPAAGDVAWSTLNPQGRFPEADPVQVEATSVDLEVRRLGLSPRMVKIDVEGHEAEVVAGMRATLSASPAVLCEVSDASAGSVVELFASMDYRAFRVAGRRLVEDDVAIPGIFNVLFAAPPHFRSIAPFIH